MIFETQRLYVRPLEEHDEAAFFMLMSNPNVMDLIPQKTLNREDSAFQLSELILLERTSDTRIWCLCEKGRNELVGICGVLKNDENQDEIAYRLIEDFWGHGYGTEITEGLIDFCFNEMKSDVITADVWVENVRSSKILNKFFTAQKEFYNTEDNCVDRRYMLKKESWRHSRWK
jgi:[ribosomal protein S5]-alanine N-acetyltransferase